MAYIARTFEESTDWYGPCPNRAGEFCGNTQKSNLRVAPDGSVLETFTSISFHTDDNGWKEASNLRIGKPSKTKSHSSEEMEAEGCVGLYLIADSTSSMFNGREIDTDVLMEEVVSGQHEPVRPLVLDVLMRKDV